VGRDVGGLSTSLGLFARLVRVNCSTPGARQLQHVPASTAARTGRAAPILHAQCRPRLIRSKVSPRGDLQRAPARCSIRPLHHPKVHVAACSRGDASRGLRDVTVALARASRHKHATRGLRSITDGLQSSRTQLIQAIRLSHERMGRNSSSIQAHGPE